MLVINAPLFPPYLLLKGGGRLASHCEANRVGVFRRSERRRPHPPRFASATSPFRGGLRNGGARQDTLPSPSMHQPACKPGSVGQGVLPLRGGHSSGTPIARRL